VTDAIMAAVKNVFADTRFTRVGGTVYGFVAKIDGKKIGVVMATKSQRFADSQRHVLNYSDFDSLSAGLDAGRLDLAFVVTAEADQWGRMTIIDVIPARELAVTLKDIVPLDGRLGKFWLIHPHFTAEEGF
jgi:hypothetical protein